MSNESPFESGMDDLFFADVSSSDDEAASGEARKKAAYEPVCLRPLWFETDTCEREAEILSMLDYDDDRTGRGIGTTDARVTWMLVQGRAEEALRVLDADLAVTKRALAQSGKKKRVRRLAGIFIDSLETMRAFALQRLSRVDEAAAALARALAFDAAMTPAVVAMTLKGARRPPPRYAELGRMLVHLGRDEEALAAYRFSLAVTNSFVDPQHTSEYLALMRRLCSARGEPLPSSCFAIGALALRIVAPPQPDDSEPGVPCRFHDLVAAEWAALEALDGVRAAKALDLVPSGFGLGGEELAHFCGLQLSDVRDMVVKLQPDAVAALVTDADADIVRCIMAQTFSAKDDPRSNCQKRRDDFDVTVL